jgi:hypothetical protein
MKAYHIAKAQNPSDLPDWLFDKRERQITNARPQSDDSVGDHFQASQTNFRADTTSGEGLALKPASHEPTPSQSRLRGTDRLKAMREARRVTGERDS